MRSLRSCVPAALVKSAFLLAAIAPVAFLSGCKSDQPIDKPIQKPAEKSIAEVLGTRPTEVNLVFTKLMVDVKVTNSYPTNLNLHDVEFSIYVDGQEVIKNDTRSQEVIDPGVTKTISIPLSISYLELLTAAPKVQPGSMVPILAEMNLKFRSPGVPPFTVALKANVPLPIPARIGADLIELRWKTLSWEGAVGTARVQFTNTNAFDVRLQKFSFTLWLSGGIVNSTFLDLDIPLAIGAKHIMEIPIMFSPRGVGFSNVHALEAKKCNSNIEGGFIMDSRFGMVELPFGHQADAPMVKP